MYRFQIFGRDEKLQFPSEIPYHQEVCLDSLPEFTRVDNSHLQMLKFVL